MFVKNVYIYPSGYASSIPPRYVGDADAFVDIHADPDCFLHHKTVGCYRRYVRVRPQEADEWEEVPDNFD